MSFEILVPCDVFQVAISVGPSAKLSKLEKLALEAIYAGVTQFSDLVKLFGIGQRPTLDLVSDLWRRGYVVLDLVQGELHLPAQVSEVLGEGRVHELECAEVSQRKEEVMQELLSDHVLPIRRQPMIKPDSQVAPTKSAIGSLRRASRAEIVQVLDSVLSELERETRPMRVLSVSLGFSGGVVDDRPIRRCHLSVRAECMRDTDSDQLSFRIVHPSTLSASVRSDMEKALKKLYDANPGHVFFRQIRERAVHGTSDELLNPAIAIQQLRSMIAGLKGINPGTVTNRHGELGLIAMRATGGVSELLACEVQAQIVPHTSGHELVLKSMIDAAAQQLVFACPYIRYDAIDRLLPSIYAALNRDVNVFILWGTDSKATLDQNLLNLFSDIRARHRNFFVERTSAKIWAKLLVQDGESVLVTTYHYLERPPGSAFDIGVQAKSRGAHPCKPVVEALLWARGEYPDYRVGDRIKTNFTPTTANPSDDTGRADDLEPKTPKDLGRNEYTESSVIAWIGEWSRYAERLARRLADANNIVQIVKDGQHREILWALLRAQTKRLLIVSKHISADVFSPPMAAALEKCLREGARVVIGYTRIDESAKELLRGLTDRYSNQMQTVRMRWGGGPNSQGHAEILLGDDLAVVSSFGFLSFEGHYDSRKRRLRSDVGVLVRGDILDKLIIAITRGLPEASRLWEHDAHKQATVPTITERAPSHSLPSVQDLIAQLVEVSDHTFQRTERLRTWFMRLPEKQSRWEMLDVLDKAALPDLPTAVACCLALQPDGSDVERIRWLRWLTARSWHTRRPFETAVLLTQLEQKLATAGDTLPPSWVVELAAYRNTPRLNDKLEDAALRHAVSDSEATCIASIALPALLYDGHPAALDCIQIWANQFPSPLFECAKAIEEYWLTKRVVVQKDVLVARVAARMSREYAADSHEALLSSLEKVKSTWLPFESGRRAWSCIFAPNGLIEPLRAAVAKNRANDARGWLREYGDRPDGIEVLLDNATDAAAGRAGHELEPIIGTKRQAVLARLRTIVIDAHAWVKANGGTAGRVERDSLELIRLGSRVAATLGGIKDLATAARAASKPEAPLLDELDLAMTSVVEATQQ